MNESVNRPARSTVKINPTPKQIDMFWKRIRRGGDSECWEWIGSRAKYGYGKFTRSYYVAHRLSWFLKNGPIPDGMCVCHKCDNPPCCNTNHLFLGTKPENNLDRHSKGRDAKGVTSGRYTKPERTARGERSGRVKLTDEKVIEIRRRRMDGETMRKLAKEFGVVKSVIGSLVKRKTWAHIP